METSPITYELDGRQYVLTGNGGVLFAWALPATASHMTAESQFRTGRQ
jgi:alcohol dehydrogenase (cytochrome c)